jgi:hypothetical protein
MGREWLSGHELAVMLWLHRDTNVRVEMDGELHPIVGVTYDSAPNLVKIHVEGKTNVTVIPGPRQEAA